jgi:hypothetical protein
MENRLTATGTTFSAGYRGDSVRAWKNAGGSTPKTYFLYDGTRPVVEMDAAGGVTAVNTFGANGLLSRRAGMVNGTLGTSVYYSFDASGNVAQRMGNGPVLLLSHVYDAYGAGQSTPAVTNEPFGHRAHWGY